MIKGNELDVVNIDFGLQTKRGDKFSSLTLVLNFKELFVSLQSDVQLRWSLEQNVDFNMNKWYMLKNQNWLFATCDRVTNVHELCSNVTFWWVNTFYAHYLTYTMEPVRESHLQAPCLSTVVKKYTFLFPFSVPE